MQAAGQMAKKEIVRLCTRRVCAFVGDDRRLHHWRSGWNMRSRLFSFHRGVRHLSDRQSTFDVANLTTIILLL